MIDVLLKRRNDPNPGLWLATTVSEGQNGELQYAQASW